MKNVLIGVVLTILVGTVVYHVYVYEAAAPHEPGTALNGTEGWKTYQNDANGFAMQYPDGYMYADHIPLRNTAEKFGIYFYPPDQYEAEGEKFTGTPAFSLLRVENTDWGSLDQWVTEHFARSKGEAEKIVFGGNSFTRIPQQGSVNHYVHLIASGASVYLVSTPRYEIAVPGVYGDMLASLRFF